MASTHKSNFDGFLGKSDGYTVYLLRGIVVKRKIVVPTKPPSLKQLAQREKAKVSGAFTKPAKDFIAVAYGPLALEKETYGYALMTSHVLKQAIKGEYPHFEIDYPKVLFSKGDMPVTPNVSVKVSDNLLEFEWDKNLLPPGCKGSDQAMFVAYCAETADLYNSVSAGARAHGKLSYELVRLKGKDQVFEIYFSFIAEDRKMVSDSVYLGQIVLPALANK
jgi:hypothetical protein